MASSVSLAEEVSLLAIVLLILLVVCLLGSIYSIK